MAAPAWIVGGGGAKLGGDTPPGSTHPGFGPNQLTYTDANGVQRWIANNEPATAANKPRFGGGGLGAPSGGQATAGAGGTSAATTAAQGAANMSWYNSPWFSTLVGAGLGYYDSKQQRDAMQGAGESSSEPWGPSIPYRMQGLDQAQSVYGGGSNAPQIPGSSGISEAAAQMLFGRAQGGDPFYGAAYGTAGSLMGGENPYRTAAGERFASMGAGENPYLNLAGSKAANYENPLLNQFAEMLFSGKSPTAGSGGGGFGSNGYFSGGGGVGGAAQEPVGAAAYIKAMLDAEYGENPALQSVIDSASRRLREQYEQATVPGVISEWQGRGRYGGGLYANAQAQAAGQYSDSLGDMIGSVSYDDFNDWNNRQMEALGLGSQMDMQAAQLAAQRASAGAGAGASRYAADQQAQLQRDAMLLDAIGMYGGEQQFGINSLLQSAGLLQGAQQFGASGLLDAGGQLDSTRLGALGMVPNITGMGLRDIQAAFGAGQGLEDNRYNQFAMNQANAGWDMDQLGRYANLVNAFSQGGGQGQQWVPPGPSSARGALSGAATGLGLYNMYRGQQQQIPWSQNATYPAGQAPGTVGYQLPGG